MKNTSKTLSMALCLLCLSGTMLAGLPLAIADEKAAILPIGRVNISDVKTQPTPSAAPAAGVESKAVAPAQPPASEGGSANGADVVKASCAACHVAGVLNAPKLGNKADWEPRIKQGVELLYEHAIKGFNAMPPRGGNPTLSDQDLHAAVDHMLELVKSDGATTQAVAEKQVATEVKPALTKVAQVEPEATPQREVTVVNKEDKKAQEIKKRRLKSERRANTFNRLMRPPSERNPPPPEDGIHDPDNPGTHMLQHPKEAFLPLAKSNSGNRVDWVRSLDRGAVNPRYDRIDPDKKPVVLDLNIVREVKGSMPNVVYPHKQHTEWLDCSNCHPKIFIPKKGANDISMASILLGEKCGVCHGKVAFPVSECRKCHSQNKPRK